MRLSILKILPVLCCTLHLHAGQLIRDARCFLENGATAAHLFVSEDLPVGDTVGVLGVLGDPGPQGDIELRLQEHDSPVTFSAYSKNLTLIRPLDKEGVDGPASVYVNVICERKHTLDPGFVIPVNIRVTDANDNAPQFVNAPYVLNISEVTVVGTRVLQGVRAVDADQPGPFSTVQYAVLPGPHSDYFVFVNALEGTLVLRKPLDYETLANFSVDIRAQDQGNPPKLSTTTLYVNVIDADDQNPAFQSDQYKILIPRNIKTRRILKVDPAPIKAVDQDVGINAPVKYTIQGGILPFLTLNLETAEVAITRPLYEHELLSPATIVVKATQIDNPDKYALSTIVVSRESDWNVEPTAGGRLPIKFIRRDHQTSIPENTPPGSVLLTTGVNKADSNLRFWLVGAIEDLERFSITNSGELILKGTLDYERRVQHSFLVRVTDGHHNDTSRVNVSVEDVNEWEPRFRHPRYEFHAATLREGSIVGKLEAADGDRDDKVSLSLRGPDARSFEIHDNGELILRSAATINGSLARLVAVASDSGRPPRSSMIPVIVHIPNSGSLPIAARAAPAWLGSSVLLVAVFGAVLGLLGVIILVLILYIYKNKRPKTSGSVSSVGTGYREKSPVPSALSPTPQVLGANMLQDALEVPRRRNRTDGAHGIVENDEETEVGDELGENDRVEQEIVDDSNHSESQEIRNDSNDIENPVFGAGNYNATIKSITSARQVPLYARHKIAPAVNPPGLSATSNIPNIGGLVQNMNDLSAKTNINAGSCESSNYSGDIPDSLVPAWPACTVSQRVKKLSWDDDDRTVDSVEVTAETMSRNSQVGNERLNLTVYF
ncbi:PREDICTED: protocadherin-like wing polarity protein stan [Eufriesea mexicana]|uniref:protocadherin-like wing polarity protein stan n=1 Tax=Eufriesea mexicana TaxID=516756 RepID=UPI00083C1F03|nr:PREDICTED: protocadherin-like wing polarity protein stan [Eufriesea mexicana]XP_017764061.1 PREDICTED: protocadherin-like wing polarity protein stan [Eufriesea mexicana]